MAPELAPKDPNLRSRVLSPFRGTNAWEALWARSGITFRSPPVRLPVIRATSRRTSCPGRKRTTAGFAPLTRQRPAFCLRPSRPDAGMPSMNRCRFAARVAEARRKRALTVDVREANAPEHAHPARASTGMVVRSCGGGLSAAVPEAPRGVPPSGPIDALRRWNDNGNGRIARREARRRGSAPVPRGHPAYPFMRDGDGAVCEPLRFPCPSRP